MTPERLQQIEDLYHSALEQDPAERAAFIDEACNGDEELRHEVETLLASEAEAEAFIQEPLLQVAARLIADNYIKRFASGGRGQKQWRLLGFGDVRASGQFLWIEVDLYA
jgi:hypothetical protein